MAVKVPSATPPAKVASNPLIGLTLAVKIGEETHDFGVQIPLNELFPGGIENPAWDREGGYDDILNPAYLDPANLTPEQVAEALGQERNEDWADALILDCALVTLAIPDVWVNEVVY